MSKVRQQDFMHLSVLVSNELCAEDLLTKMKLDQNWFRWLDSSCYVGCL